MPRLLGSFEGQPIFRADPLSGQQPLILVELASDLRPLVTSSRFSSPRLTMDDYHTPTCALLKGGQK